MSMEDRTVIRPMPGGRAPRKPQPAPPVMQQQQPVYAPPPPVAMPLTAQHDDNGVHTAQSNPILALISPLLTLASKVRKADQHPDLDEFHRYAVDQIRYYQSIGWGCEANQETAAYISYALCALIDETVQNTPWGLNSDWGSKSLLITFHQEAWGGKKFFQYLNEFIQRPAASLMLLEMYYSCLAMGFEGEYRTQNNGRRNLDVLRDEVFIAISRQRSNDDARLSLAWQGVSEKAQGINRYLPLWIIATVTAAIVLSIYISLMWQINNTSDDTMTQFAAAARVEAVSIDPYNLEQLYKVDVVVQPQPDIVKPPFDYVALLSPPLSAEIAAGTVEIIDREKITIVRLRDAKLFPSGRAELSAEFEPLVLKIGQTLSAVTEPILVVGHSDNIPMRSGRFPSNWELSTARADAVLNILGIWLRADLKANAEGIADSEPLVDNSTAANRALNRRVEIHLRK